MHDKKERFTQCRIHKIKKFQKSVDKLKLICYNINCSAKAYVRNVIEDADVAELADALL